MFCGIRTLDILTTTSLTWKLNTIILSNSAIIMYELKSWPFSGTITPEDHPSRSAYVVVLAGVLLLFSVLQAFRTYSRWRRVRQLGNSAQSLPSRLPLGLDLAFTTSQKMRAHEFLDWTDEIL